MGGYGLVAQHGGVITREVYGAPDDANGYLDMYNGIARGFWWATQERTYSPADLYNLSSPPLECYSTYCDLPRLSGEISCDAPTLCLKDHVKGKLLKDSVISDGVSFGQSLSVNGNVAETQKKRLLTMSDRYICKFSEASATQQLPEHQDQHVIPMRERPASGLVVVLGDYTPEMSLRKELRDLSENILPDMHGNTDFDSAVKVAISKIGHSFEKISRCA